jgi:Ca-activated chloride channel family protein
MPADGMWITIGDKQHVVKDVTSIYRSPVVFGVKKSVAERLGWTKGNVTVGDILKASQAGKLRFMMTSATQSNSGAAAYFGFLYAFAGNPDVLSEADLNKPEVASKIKQMLGGVNRSSGSSGWLKDLFVQRYDYFDAMVNYEAMIIEANQTLTANGQEPLYAVYPVDGLAIANAPLGFVNKGDAAKEALFLKMQSYLTSADVQKKLLASGRRAGLGINVPASDAQAFNTALGFDANRVLTPINMPPAEVIQKALVLYQTAFRKPSLTIFAIDYSGSMRDNGGEEGVKSAMRMLLDQQQAERYMLQASPKDIIIVVPFDAAPRGLRKVIGNNPDQLRALSEWLTSMNADGGTDIYSPIVTGMQDARKYRTEDYSTAVILMTDGESNTGMSFNQFKADLAANGLSGVPIHAIRFGDADPNQLKALNDLSGGRLFDGRKDLISAFREARGYN